MTETPADSFCFVRFAPAAVNDHFAAQLPKFPVIASAKRVAIRNSMKRKRIPTAFGLGMTRMQAACFVFSGAWQKRTERAPGSNDTQRTVHELGAAARRKTIIYMHILRISADPIFGGDRYDRKAI